MIPFILNSSKTELVLAKNRKAMYFRALRNENSVSHYKHVSGIGSTWYSDFYKPNLDQFEFDYALGDRWLAIDFLGELSYMKIENQLHKLSDCITCDQLVTTKEESFAEINIQPNPVIDYLNFSATSTIKNYEIYNLAGQVLLSDINNNSESRHSIDVTSLTKGMYFVKLNFSSGGGKVYKFLKE